eukprot:15466411-Alexandrium_andersonii.AAC.1
MVQDTAALRKRAVDSQLAVSRRKLWTNACILRRAEARPEPRPQGAPGESKRQSRSLVKRARSSSGEAGAPGLSSFWA